jgi:hypothetical protein
VTLCRLFRDGFFVGESGTCSTNRVRVHFQKNIQAILVEHEINHQDPLPRNYLDPIKALWVDGGVKQAIAKGNEFALHDNLE